MKNDIKKAENLRMRHNYRYIGSIVVGTVERHINFYKRQLSKIKSLNDSDIWELIKCYRLLRGKMPSIDNLRQSFCQYWLVLL